MESHRRAEQAKAERRSKLRTRDGVVDLAEWRQALQDERFARETFGGVAGVASIRVAPAEDVGFVMEILLVEDDPMLRRCLPSEVNEVPVRVRGPQAGSG